VILKDREPTNPGDDRLASIHMAFCYSFALANG
jgi:hypothetical protein